MMVQMMIICERVQQKHSLSIWDLAKLIGKMTATLPAIYQAPLWYRELQCLKNQALQLSQSSGAERGSHAGAGMVVYQDESGEC